MVHEVEWVSVEDQWGSQESQGKSEGSVEDQWGSILITEDRKGPEGLGGDSLEHNRDQKGTLCDLQYILYCGARDICMIRVISQFHMPMIMDDPG